MDVCCLYSYGNRIFKVTIESHRSDGRIEPFSDTQFSLAPALKEKYPDIKDATRIFKARALVRYGSKAFNEDRFYFTDPSLFEMFTFSVKRFIIIHFKKHNSKKAK